MKFTTVCSICFSFILLQGCATLSESECATANWQQIGFKDGSVGEQRDQLNRHQKSCAKHGYTVDAESYWEGRALGLKEFCTAKMGYSKGIEGDEYFDVCPTELANAFKKSYVKGLKIKLDELSIEYDRLDDELSRSRLERAVLAHKKPSKKLNDNIDYLQSRLRNLLSERQEIQHWIAKWSGP